jgi:hypothetical protein
VPNGNEQILGELRVDRSNLYREETITDLKVASLKQLIPITENGDRDLGRKPVFVGQTQLMSQMGPLPVQAQIEADTLGEAMDAFPKAMQEAVEQMIEEAREAQRREASRIVTPGRDFPSNLDLGQGPGPSQK